MNIIIWHILKNKHGLSFLLYMWKYKTIVPYLRFRNWQDRKLYNKFIKFLVWNCICVWKKEMYPVKLHICIMNKSCEQKDLKAFWHIRLSSVCARTIYAKTAARWTLNLIKCIHWENKYVIYDEMLQVNWENNNISQYLYINTFWWVKK